MGNMCVSGRILGWATQHLKDQYPNLYYLAHQKHDTVHKVLGGDLANISFRRNLINNNNRGDWLDLLTRIVNIELQDGPDVCI